MGLALIDGQDVGGKHLTKAGAMHKRADGEWTAKVKIFSQKKTLSVAIIRGCASYY